MLVQGKWAKDWGPVQQADARGRFLRQVSSFRNWITPDGAAGPTGEGGFAAVIAFCGHYLPLGLAGADGAQAEGA